MIQMRLRDAVVVALATAALVLSTAAAGAAGTSASQFALAGHHAYLAEMKAAEAAFAGQLTVSRSCQPLIQAAPPSLAPVILSELTATDADEPAYKAFADTLGKVSTGSSVLRSARAVIEREATALKQLVAMKLDINPCDYYAGWKASGWAHGYNPYPAHVAALDFFPMYTPLANARRLLAAAGGSAAKYATQFRAAALMIKSTGLRAGLLSKH